MKPALFLDRDDTLVFDESYMSRPEQIRLLPGAKEAIKLAAEHFDLYLLTNQSGINRGYYTFADAEACNARLIELLEISGFAGICIAPETPDEPSKYRKPSPAYILERIEEDKLDPTKCWIIGDKRSDIECGVNANVGSILVFRGATGAPRESAKEYAEKNQIPICESILEAVNFALNKIK
jgi:histidinol-phosphate phosphatase family protein